MIHLLRFQNSHCDARRNLSISGLSNSRSPLDFSALIRHIVTTYKQVESFCLEPGMNEKPEDIFRSCGGLLRMSEAIERGITRYTLYSLRDRGVIEQVSRGVYRLVELPPISNPDLVTVGLRFPNAVICLVSALTYHEITTQIPHSVSVAVPRKSRLPSLDYPPLLVHRFSDRHTALASRNIKSTAYPSKSTPRKNARRLFQISQ